MASTHPPPAAGLWCARHLTSTRRRTPPKRLATARGSAPPSPAARAHQPPAQRWPPAVSGSRAGIGPAGVCVCQQGCALAARRTAAAGGGHAARSSALDAPSSAVGRRASGRPRRGAVAAVLPHMVTTTTVACQVVGSRARCHRVQMATIAERGANAGTARRARDGRRAHPANRHRDCIRARSCVRRLTILVPIGAGFGHGTRTHTLTRTLAGRDASKCAVRPQSGARGRSLAQITWRADHLDGIT